MSPGEPPQPARTGTPTEFTEALRTLRIWSELTYRQLEGKATAHGEALPASTIASTLSRATLPRERFVKAFTRACGLSDAEVREWLEARRRIAAHEHARNNDASGDSPEVPSSTNTSAAARSPWWPRVAGLAGAVGIGVASTLGISSRFHDSPASTAIPTMPVTGLRMLAVGSWARIHPVRTPDLCLTEGRDRTGRYQTAVAAQR
ncbi:helix-turn-helix domain-containing protein [Streptomyces sp. NPDC088178]|uniref:helix-turn-helix domain-containing protein n=1 Tax=Streptomyces sp. NPDC088178 TaxID=3365836 RepID=UPI0038022E50